MRIGVSFPHHAIGPDPAAIRDWAQAADDLGIDHLIVYEHIILPDQALHPDETFRYTHETVLHEPLTLCSYLAAVTRRVGLQTGILVLPLHETVIVGKQLAEVDVLSGGRLRLGVGVGWLEFEFAALGRDFHSRGARMDEQIALLRGLWTGPSVTFHGREHHIEGAGINPFAGPAPAARVGRRQGPGDCTAGRPVWCWLDRSRRLPGWTPGRRCSTDAGLAA